MHLNRCASSALALAVGLISGTGAIAQTTQQSSPPTVSSSPNDQGSPAAVGVEAPPPAAQASSGLQDIIVTARRTQESAQKVPLAITVQTGEVLAQHQITDIYGLKTLTPSLQVQSIGAEVGATRFAIRGIGTSVVGPQVESSVGIVFDDVPLARPELGNIQFYDLARVEILRGPQGMLFGKNAAAGLINIISTAPALNKSEFLASATYGNMTTAPSAGNQGRIDVAGNTPIGQNAALRIDGSVIHNDAYVKNINPDHQDNDLGFTQESLRAKLRWEPSAQLRFLASVDYAHENGTAESTLAHRIDAPGGVFAFTDAQAGIVASPSNVRQASDGPNTNRYEVYGGSLKAEYELPGGFTLTNIAGARKATSYAMVDQDATQRDYLNYVQQNLRFSQVTEELRLTSPRDKPLTYQAGFFYLDFKGRGGYQFLGGSSLAPFILGAPLPPIFLNLIGSASDIKLDNQSYAGYFEANYKLFDKVTLTGGVRYTHDSYDYTTVTTAIPRTLVPIIAPANVETKTGQNNVSYRFIANYAFTPDILAYASYARGYKGPTFDQFTGIRVNPEIPKVVELGLKSTLFNRHLRLNVALYHELFENFQTTAFDPSTTTVRTVNAGSLRAQGVEAEFAILPFRGLTLTGGVTYNDTEYRNLLLPCYPGEPTGITGRNVCTPAGVASADGNILALAPRWTESVTARYEHPLGGTWTGFLQGDAYVRSHFYYAATNDPKTRQNHVALIGLSAGARQENGPLGVNFFVRNLTDKRVPLLIQNDQISGAIGDTAKGGDYDQTFGADSFRTIGVTFSIRI